MKFCRLIALTAIISMAFALALIAVRFPWPVLLGLIVWAFVEAKRKYTRLTTLGSARWAEGDDLRQAGMLDAKTGLITLNAGGKTLLSGGAPNFWRGLTDNDEGTGVLKSHAIWKTFTEQRQVRSVDVTNDAVSILYSCGTGSVHWKTTYRLLGDGALQVVSTFTPLRDDLPDPLRLGLRFDTDPALTDLEWYGRGPQETYVDRRTGAGLGIYKGKIADQYHAYSRPMESGNKTDVRWVSLSGNGAGLTVKGDQPLSVNALAFPYEDLYFRKQGTWKSSDIAPHGDGSLLIDLVQTGVGGDTGFLMR